MSIHPLARRFGPVAEQYDRSRPDYPREAIAWLVERLGLAAGDRVVDLAAGTGKLTALLEDQGLRPVAVEPSAGMRRVLRRGRPRSPLVAGTAEAFPVRTGAVHAVFVGSAFHWFDPRRAAEEIARALRPGGGLGIAYNVRDESAAWTREVGALLDRLDTGGPRARSGQWRRGLEESGRFEALEKASFGHRQSLTPEGLVDRVLTVSYVAARPAAERRQVAAEVRALLDRHPETAGRARLEYPYRAEVYATRARAA